MRLARRPEAEDAVRPPDLKRRAVALKQQAPVAPKPEAEVHAAPQPPAVRREAAQVAGAVALLRLPDRRMRTC
jgi:hypothetical protein